MTVTPAILVAVPEFIIAIVVATVVIVAIIVVTVAPVGRWGPTQPSGCSIAV